jgi:hypothetical protein
MNGQRSRYGPSNGIDLLRPWLAAQIVGVVLALAPQLFGANLCVSVSYSVGSDGTIYATGVNDAGHVQMHSCWVQTTIYSPGGRSGYGYQSVGSGGYAVANASLAFDQNDLGDYTIEAYGCGT